MPELDQRGAFMFNFDWFHHGGLEKQVCEARRRCMVKHFPDQTDPEDFSAEAVSYMDQLETRTIIYLKDGLSYEMKELAQVGTNSALSFECVPVDENYAVGAYVLVVPFDDIARVEVFAVHPDEKPVENVRIGGFKAAYDTPG
jgi:hypothetical protein